MNSGIWNINSRKEKINDKRRSNKKLSGYEGIIIYPSKERDEAIWMAIRGLEAWGKVIDKNEFTLFFKQELRNIREKNANVFQTSIIDTFICLGSVKIIEKLIDHYNLDLSEVEK